MAKEKASAALFDQLQTAIAGGEGEEIVGKVKVNQLSMIRHTPKCHSVSAMSFCQPNALYLCFNAGNTYMHTLLSQHSCDRCCSHVLLLLLELKGIVVFSSGLLTLPQMMN